MGFYRIACNGVYHFFICVNNYINNIFLMCHFTGSYHIFMNRISF